MENISNIIDITKESCEQVNEELKLKQNKQILEDLNIKILTNLKITDSAHLEDIETKYKIAINQISSSNPMHFNKNISASTYHLFYKNVIYRELCYSSSEKLILLCNTLKLYLEQISSVDNCKHNLVANVLMELDRNIFAHLKEKFNLFLKRVTLTSKIKEMHIIGFQVKNCLIFTQFYISNNELSAEIGALQKMIAALLLYLK